MKRTTHATSILLSVSLCLLSSFTLATEADSLAFFIPQPKAMEMRSGSFSLDEPVQISAPKSASFSAQLLKESLQSRFDKIRFSADRVKQKIELIIADSTEQKSIWKSLKVTPLFTLGDEGYGLVVSNQKISIVARHSAGVFYGVQTLTQLINNNHTSNNIPCIVIFDKPDMAIRGWQDDISRGPIPTIVFLKQEIKRMASFKLNTFTLYTEHVFKLKKHPSIAPPDGITADELNELINYAKDYHVDVIGNFQSFGHFTNILKVPGYREMGDDEHTLSPASEIGYSFLKDVYSEIVPAYSSKHFHINCDEVGLGRGSAKSLVDSLGLENVYAYHINRIDSLLKPFSKQIMMWGDIAVRHPDIISRLPKDMIIVSWGYAEMESMDEEIVPFVESGFKFIVAPGVSCWSRIFPDLERANINIYNYLRDGYRHGALGFINTTWDDDGQNLFNNNWYGLAWGAECGWNAPAFAEVKESEALRKKRVAIFNKSYDRIVFQTDKEVASLIHYFSELRKGPVKNSFNTTAIWQPLLPDYQLTPENFESENLILQRTVDSIYNLTVQLRNDASINNTDLDYFLFAQRQVRLVLQKNILGIKLKQYVTEEQDQPEKTFQPEFKTLNDTIAELKKTYTALWERENRKWWLDTVKGYYDNFKNVQDDLSGVCIIKASDKLVEGKRKIVLQSAFNDMPVYYTTNGKQPTLQSTKYITPLLVDTNILIKAQVFENDKNYPLAQDSLVFHKGIGSLHRLNSKWNTDNPAYAARGKYGLLDGRRGSRNNFNDGRWQAYFGDDLDIDLDFGEPVQISSIKIGFAQLMRYGILYPQLITISASKDGLTYTPLKEHVNTINPNTTLRSTHDFEIAVDQTTTRYLKVYAKNTSVLPDWHYAKGKTGWLFADEIIIE